MERRGLRKQGTPPEPPATGRVEDAARAADVAWASLAFGEGGRVGFLGDTGVGKTTLSRYLVGEWLRRTPGAAIVVDGKGWRSKYEGESRRNIDDLRAAPLADGVRTVIIRGDVMTGETVDPEAVARYAWNVAVRNRIPVLVVFDELAHACSGGSWKSGVTWVPKLIAEGREVRVSVLWGSQTPQQVPVLAFDETKCIACFKSDGAALKLLETRQYLNGIDRSVIAGLPGEESPPGERGKFVLLRRGTAWDGRFYRVA